MRYAINENNEKIEPQFSGQRALCPGCKKEVAGKIYKDKMNHWAHLKSDCDKWYEPTSEWHLKWQNLFPKENQEVFMVDEELGERHRADIRLNNGVVIEIQNSPIVIKEVAQREKFYGQKGLIWILNAEKLAPRTTYVREKEPLKWLVKISFSYSFFAMNQVDYIVSKLRMYLREVNKKINSDNIEFEFHSYAECYSYSNGNEFDKSQLNTDIEFIVFDSWERICSEEDYNTKVEILEYKNVEYLIGNQWRKFIDEMQAPVFIDNVKNIGTEYLWWVQEEKKVEKERFIKKYLSYT